MRVGIFLHKRLRPYSVDFDGCASEIAAAGHEPVLICPGNDRGPLGYRVVEGSDEEFRSPAFWSGLGLDMAICFVWMRHPDILRALRSAGVSVLLRSDSDGQFSFRTFRREAFHRLVGPATGPVDFLRRLRHFVRCILWLSRDFDAEALETLRLADAIAIETREAQINLDHFLARSGQSELSKRVHIIPHAVPDIFLSAPLDNPRPARIFCAGRWDDDQKNPELLAATIRWISMREPGVEFFIAGAGVERVTRAIGSARPKITVAGLLPREDLPALLGGCRILLSSSRWESHPIGALEALCCGCTVVSTPVPGFAALAQDGRYGTLSSRHHAADLGAACLAELALWEKSARDPHKIASHWRPLVSNKAVVQQLLQTYVRPTPH